MSRMDSRLRGNDGRGGAVWKAAGGGLDCGLRRNDGGVA